MLTQDFFLFKTCNQFLWQKSKKKLSIKCIKLIKGDVHLRNTAKIKDAYQAYAIRKIYGIIDIVRT